MIVTQHWDGAEPENEPRDPSRQVFIDDSKPGTVEIVDRSIVEPAAVKSKKKRRKRKQKSLAQQRKERADEIDRLAEEAMESYTGNQRNYNTRSRKRGLSSVSAATAVQPPRSKRHKR